VIEVAIGRLDSDVVGRQPDVGVGAAVILLDVQLKVVRVGDRSETRHQGKAVMAMSTSLSPTWC
jgi:hypothetical protein